MEKLLFAPFSQESFDKDWITLLRTMSKILLHVAAYHAELPQTPLCLEIVKQIIDTQKYPVHARYSAQHITKSLMNPTHGQDLYGLIRTHILAIRPENRSAPSLTSAVSLVLLPFKTFALPNADWPSLVSAFIASILTIPLLLQRIPTQSVTLLSNSIPFADLLSCFSTRPIDLHLTIDDARSMMINMEPLVEPRIKTFKSIDNLIGWLNLIGYALEHIPTNQIVQHVEANSAPDLTGKGKARASDVDQPTSSIRSSSTAVSPSRIWSHDHLQAVLASSKQFSASPKARPALARFLCSLLTVLPASAVDDVRTFVVYENRFAGPGLIREIWRNWLRAGALSKRLAGAKGTDGWRDVSKMLSLRNVSSVEEEAEWHLLILLVHLYTRTLLTLGDDEFYAGQDGSSGAARNPLQLDDIKALSAMLRNIGFALYWSGEIEAHNFSMPGLSRLKGEAFRDLVRGLLVSIHERDSRRPFLAPDHWHMIGAFDVSSFIESAILEDERLDQEERDADLGISALPLHSDSDEDMPTPVKKKPRTEAQSRRRLAQLSPRLGVLNNIPFVIPFETRVSVFRQLVMNDKRRIYQMPQQDLQRMRVRSATHVASIRRGHVAEDGFTHLRHFTSFDWKSRLQIEFIDQYGEQEAGIDGGGLFKEFLTSLGQEAFDANRGLWRSNSRQEVYPAALRYAKEPVSLQWFTFLGQIVGKALYEGILVSIPFAGFFLSKWLGRTSYVDDLASLDPELYNGLLALKNYTGDVRDLSLTFAVDEEDMGVNRTVDLMPGGRDIAVTNENRFRYITLISYYRLNAQIREQSAAFVDGLHDLINPRWLRLFSQAELRSLVGGTEEPIDIDDLRANTVYAGIEEASETVRHFWSVLNSFDPEQRRAFVRFVTSADKAPLLGFKELQPRFAIRNGGADETRLPSASTCVNLLKLPAYRSRQVLQSKLLLAINAQAGFDLS